MKAESKRPKARYFIELSFSPFAFSFFKLLNNYKQSTYPPINLKFALEMPRTKKHLLSLEREFDFDMIGICSHHSDYRLAFGINEAFHLHLKKADEDFCTDHSKKNKSTKHSFYDYNDQENICEYFLIKNISGGKYLITEQPKIDYFLFVRAPVAIDTKEWIKKLNDVPSVLAAYAFDPEELESMQTISL